MVLRRVVLTTAVPPSLLWPLVPQVESALVGKPINQATHDACQAALVLDINSVGPSTYWGTTDTYRRQAAAGLLFKVCVCRAGAA